MAAERPQRRKITAKEAAQRFGISERSVRRIVAEPREEYLARAAALRAAVIRLREVEKLPYKEISDQLGIPASSARRIITTARKQQRESTLERVAS